MSHRGSVFQDGGIGQPLDYRIAAHANALDKELAYKGEQERLQRKQAERDNAISDISNVKVGDTGLNPVDAVKNQAIPALQAEAFSRLKAKESPMAVRSWLNQEVGKLSSAYTLAKNSKDIADKNFLDIAKAYPKADMGKLKSMVYGDIANDIVQKGEDGSYGGLKDASVIPLDKDYTGPYLDPQNLGKWYNASGELKDYAEGLKLNEVSDSDKFDNKGKVIKHGYKGKSNFLSRPITDPKTGDVIGQETAYDEVDDGSGNKLKVLPETQEREILADPRRAAELNQIVAPELAEIESATGKEIDPKQAHLMMRNRLYQIMDQHKTHTFNTNDETRVPKPAQIHVNTGGGSASKEVTIRDVYGNIKNIIDDLEKQGLGSSASMAHLPITERGVVLKFAKEATSDNELTSEDIYIAKDKNGILNLYKKGEGEGKQNILIGPLDKVGTNVPAQPTAPGKQKVIKQGAATAPPPSGKIHFVGPDGKTYEGTEETLKKMDKAGVKYTRK